MYIVFDSGPGFKKIVMPKFVAIVGETFGKDYYDSTFNF